ncbi:MAG: DUF2400 family protein [Ignavibacteriales bacterium]|nr:DUF2400 family protein [Ignavibacteriales bacterium]
MGGSPSQFILRGDYSFFEGLYYRFQKSDDIVYLFVILKHILERFGSMGAMLRHFYRGDTRNMLWQARDELFGKDERLTFFFLSRPIPTL